MVLAAACVPADDVATRDPDRPIADSPRAEAADSMTDVPGDYMELERGLFDRVNEHRLGERKPSLKWDEAVAEVAREHSRNMAAGRVGFGHDGFDARAGRLKREVRWSAIAENLATNNYARHETAERAFTGLVYSDGHRRNMEGDYERTGVGVARSADGFWFYTQIFTR
jgi:uncharacterized protein YkwD